MGHRQRVYLVMAQTDASKGLGINCLMVEKGMEGFQVGARRTNSASVAATRTP